MRGGSFAGSIIRNCIGLRYAATKESEAPRDVHGKVVRMVVSLSLSNLEDKDGERRLLCNIHYNKVYAEQGRLPKTKNLLLASS